MQNKPNLPKAQMNVNKVLTKDYENISDWTLGENKPNTKPIKANLLDVKMNVTSVLTKDYENERFSRLRENKPNQTQSTRPRYFVNSATLVWGLFRDVGFMAWIRSKAFFICVALIGCPPKVISYNTKWSIFQLKASN